MLGESKNEHERKLFFEWVTNGIQSKPPLNNENIEFLFEYLLMDDQKFPTTNVSESFFACFKWIFLNYHNNEGNIELVNNKFKYRKAETLKGFEKLILIELNSEHLQNEAAKLIINLLLRYSPQTFNMAPKIQEEFTDSLLSIILQNKDNDFIATKGLNLIKMLLGDIDEDDFVPTTYVYVHENMSRDFYKIHYDQSKTLRHLRKEVAKHYQKPLECTFLQFNEKKYSGIDDDLELSTIKTHCIIIEFRNPDYKELNPLPGLSLNQKVIKTLFELLSNNEKSYTNVA